jgi:hypothetical protein
MLGGAKSVGFYNTTPIEPEETADTEWTVYLEYGEGNEWNRFEQVFYPEDPNWPDGQVSLAREDFGDTFYGDKFSSNISWEIGTALDCPDEVPTTEEDVCKVNGLGIESTYNRYIYQRGEPPNQYLVRYPNAIATRTINFVEPETDPGYVPCTFRLKARITTYAHKWGYNSDGTSAAPDADPVAYQYWLDNRSGDPPCPGDGVRFTGDRGDFIQAANWIQIVNDPEQPILPVVTDFFEPSSYEEWMEATVAKLDEEMDFDAVPVECMGDSCFSYEERDPKPTLPPWGDINITRQLARYRLGVPENYSTEENPRSFFQIQWDEVFFPKEWDDWAAGGMEGESPSVQPSIIAEREWTWGGSMEPEDNQFSPWYNLEIQEAPGQVRPVNVLTLCWTSSRIGSVPSSSGEVYPPEGMELKMNNKTRSQTTLFI